MNVIVCMPGQNFSGTFLKCWTNFLSYCFQVNINIILSQVYDSNVYLVRTRCLGGDVLRGENQKPFDGKIDYDYIMWIDSDIIFQPNHFKKLVDDIYTHNLDICSGLYLMDGGKEFATVRNWDVDYFLKNKTFQFLTPKDIEGNNNLIEVDYTGFGFILMKKGVIERMKYPWFKPNINDFGNGIIDFSSEDVSFCHNAKDVGIKVYVDPTIIVGHEKPIIYVKE